MKSNHQSTMFEAQWPCRVLEENHPPRSCFHQAIHSIRTLKTAYCLVSDRITKSIIQKLSKYAQNFVLQQPASAGCQVYKPLTHSFTHHTKTVAKRRSVKINFSNYVVLFTCARALLPPLLSCAPARSRYGYSIYISITYYSRVSTDLRPAAA